MGHRYIDYGIEEELRQLREEEERERRREIEAEKKRLAAKKDRELPQS